MMCFPLVVGEVINLDFKHTTLATQRGDCPAFVVSLADAHVLNTLCFTPAFAVHLFYQSHLLKSPSE